MKRKIAIPALENGVLDSHFGHCRFFEIYETTDNQITSHVIMVPPPHEPGVLPKWLVKNGISDVIVGGIGEKAVKILDHFEINVHKGAPQQECAVLINNFLNQTLVLSENSCNHDHNHEHHHHHHSNN